MIPIEKIEKVTLYIAEHNVTKMKYFGSTTRFWTAEQLQKYYHGSGVLWKDHLKNFGDDVSMKIYGIYDKDIVQRMALNFSRENDIVNSKKWANLINEDGIGVEYYKSKYYNPK